MQLRPILTIYHAGPSSSSCSQHFSVCCSALSFISFILCPPVLSPLFRNLRTAAQVRFRRNQSADHWQHLPCFLLRHVLPDGCRYDLFDFFCDCRSGLLPGVSIRMDSQNRQREIPLLAFWHIWAVYACSSLSPGHQRRLLQQLRRSLLLHFLNNLLHPIDDIICAGSVHLHCALSGTKQSWKVQHLWPQPSDLSRTGRPWHRIHLPWSSRKSRNEEAQPVSTLIYIPNIDIPILLLLY